MTRRTFWNLFDPATLHVLRKLCRRSLIEAYYGMHVSAGSGARGLSAQWNLLWFWPNTRRVTAANTARSNWPQTLMWLNNIFGPDTAFGEAVEGQFNNGRYLAVIYGVEYAFRMTGHSGWGRGKRWSCKTVRQSRVNLSLQLDRLDFKSPVLVLCNQSDAFE